jgi:hypothetical protein
MPERRSMRPSCPMSSMLPVSDAQPSSASVFVLFTSKASKVAEFYAAVVSYEQYAASP